MKSFVVRISITVHITLHKPAQHKYPYMISVARYSNIENRPYSLQINRFLNHILIRIESLFDLLFVYCYLGEMQKSH